MGRKALHRHEIIDRDFPVRTTVRADPATYELTRQWLQRHIGAHDYASKSQIMYSAQPGQCGYFLSAHAALMFPAGCLHIQLHWENILGQNADRLDGVVCRRRALRAPPKMFLER